MPRRVAILALLPLLLAGCGGGGSDDPATTSGTGGVDGTTGGPSSASGVRLVEIETMLFDGRTRVETFGWDDEGRLLSETVSEGGVVVESRRYTWLDATRFVSREDDLGGDGGVDRFLDYSFTPDGSLGGARIDAADGSAIGGLQYSVAGDGNVESLEITESGNLVRRETYSYGSAGDLESSAIDVDGDGSVDTILGYEYAEDGTVAGTIETVANLPAGGGGEQTATWTYERGECIRNWFNSVFRPYCVTFR